MINNLVLAPIKSFDSYLVAISQIPRLSMEEEYELAFNYKNNDDLDSATKLIMANLRFVAYIAKGYIGYGLPLEDLVQEGNVGLMKAVKKFDPTIGVRLVTYAVHWIKAEIHEYIVKNWKLVKIATTKTQHKLFFNLRKLKKDTKLTLKDANLIATTLNVSLKDVYEMETRLDGNDITIDPTLEDCDINSNFVKDIESANSNPEILLENQEWNEYQENSLENALYQLDDRSRDIINCRWLTEEKTTLQELSIRYNVSIERIRQLEQNALKKLKRIITVE